MLLAGVRGRTRAVLSTRAPRLHGPKPTKVCRGVLGEPPRSARKPSWPNQRCLRDRVNHFRFALALRAWALPNLAGSGSTRALQVSVIMSAGGRPSIPGVSADSSEMWSGPCSGDSKRMECAACLRSRYHLLGKFRFSSSILLRRSYVSERTDQSSGKL
jgi:hypothetical protein